MKLDKSVFEATMMQLNTVQNDRSEEHTSELQSRETISLAGSTYKSCVLAIMPFVY